MSSMKRKWNVVAIEMKFEIIDQLAKGVSSSSAVCCNGKATVADIRTQKKAILQYTTKQDCSKSRNGIKSAIDAALEGIMFTWFNQKRSLGEPISGSLLCEKALLLNQKMVGHCDFKASTSWLRAFKSRHGMKELHLEGETLSGDSNVANKFRKGFSELLEKKAYSRDNVYNADGNRDKLESTAREVACNSAES